MSVLSDRMERSVRAIDAINEWLGRGISWLALTMVMVTFVVVVLRYVFNLGWIAMQESVTYMHGMLFMLGAAYTLRHDGHVRMDVFYRRMGPRGKAWVDLLGTLFLLVPVCGFTLWVSGVYVASSWAVLESSRETGGLPGVFLIKTLIPIFAVLFLLQGISLALRSLLVLMGFEHLGPQHTKDLMGHSASHE